MRTKISLDLQTWKTGWSHDSPCLATVQRQKIR